MSGRVRRFILEPGLACLSTSSLKGGGEEYVRLVESGVNRQLNEKSREDGDVPADIDALEHMSL